MLNKFAEAVIPSDSNPFPTTVADDNAVTTVIQTAAAVIAVISVIFIIIGGFRYVTSVGNPEQTKRAKDTILYAVAGIVVALLAVTIVSFVLGAVGDNAITPTP